MDHSSLTIRVAVPEDAPALLDIYAPYVKNTAITFEYELPSTADFRERIRRTLERYPYLVAESDCRPVGYAYASAFKERAAYDWSVETSIYVRMDSHRKGVGRALYRALEDYLARQRVCNLCACIAFPNPVSEAFHASFGYRAAAHFHASGYKLGRWHDMIWMEKELCPHGDPPLPFVPFPQIYAKGNCEIYAKEKGATL